MFKGIIADLREYAAHFKAYIFFLRMSIKMRLAIRMADNMQRALNKQITLVLNANHKFEWWTPKMFDEAKRRGAVPKSWGQKELNEVCFYRTNVNANNDKRISREDREAYKQKFIAYAKKYMYGGKRLRVR